MAFDPQEAAALLLEAARLRGLSEEDARAHARLPEARPQRISQRKRKRNVHETASAPATGDQRDEVASLLPGYHVRGPLTDSARRMLTTATRLVKGKGVTQFEAAKLIDWLGRQQEQEEGK